MRLSEVFALAICLIVSISIVSCKSDDSGRLKVASESAPLETKKEYDKYENISRSDRITKPLPKHAARAPEVVSRAPERAARAPASVPHTTVVPAPPHVLKEEGDHYEEFSEAEPAEVEAYSETESIEEMSTEIEIDAEGIPEMETTAEVYYESDDEAVNEEGEGEGAGAGAGAEDEYEYEESKISNGYWNTWFYKDGKVFDYLQEKTRYTFTLDLAAYTYRLAKESGIGSAPADDLYLMEYLNEMAKKYDTIHLVIRPVLLGNNLEFPPEINNSGQTMKIAFDKLRPDSEQDKLFEKFKAKEIDLQKFAESVNAGRVSFPLIAKKSGCATIALSIWDESGTVPLDHLLHTIEIVDSDGERHGCIDRDDKNALSGGLATLLSKSIAEEETKKPDAALHIFEVEKNGDTRSIVIFVDSEKVQSAGESDSDRGVYSWEMQDFLSSYISDPEGLLDRVQLARTGASKNECNDDCYIDAARELRDYIFSADNDDDKGQKQAQDALKAFQRLVASSDKPVILARVVDKGGNIIFIPLGILSSPAPSGEESVLKNPIIVVQPLPIERYMTTKGCIQNWTFGLPKILSGAGSSINTELSGIDTTTYTDTIRWVRDYNELKYYFQDNTSEWTGGEGLLLLAHHSKGRIWFLPEKRVIDKNIWRRYPPGSVAILAACSAGELSGDNGKLLEALNKSGIDAFVVSPFPIDTDYGVQLALSFKEAITNALENKEYPTLAELFSTATEITIKYFNETANYKSWGLMSQEFILVGDQNIRLCGP